MTLSTADLWEQFSGQLLGFIRRRVNDPQEAEDLLQDVFLRIHTHIDTLQDEDRFVPWMYQIARNAIIDHHRGTRPWIDLDETIPLEFEETELDPDPAADIAAGLGDLVDCLPDKYRQAVKMSELQGLRQQDVADQLGISLSGAKSRVQRGRALMRQSLLDCCHFEFDRRGKVMDYYPRQVCCRQCSK
jgi:RNA polymerase sigma-70 factor (ECF subfamily)